MNAGDVGVVSGANVPRAYSARFVPRTFASTGFGATVSTAATVFISGGPTSSTGGSLQLQNSFGLLVEGGATWLQDLLTVNSGINVTGASNLTGAVNVNGLTTLSTTTISQGIKISTMTANPIMGSATMVGGTVVVNNTRVTANSIIILTAQNNAGTIGSVSVSARTAGTSFTIKSTNALDVSRVGWLILEPSP